MNSPELLQDFGLWNYIQRYLLRPKTLIPLAVDQLDAIEMDIEYERIILNLIKDRFSYLNVSNTRTNRLIFRFQI